MSIKSTRPAHPTQRDVCAALIIPLLLMPTVATAQQREFYDTRTGKVSGRATTDSQGSTTIYDSSGRVTGRTAVTSEGTVIYDSAGRRVGTATTTNPQRSK